MNNYAKLISPETLQIDRMLPGPIERVWEYITDGEKRALWFAGGDMELNEGGRMNLIFNNSTLSFPPDQVPEKYKEYQDGHESYAIVVRCEPPKLLVINWDNGIVTFALSEVGEEVKLTLTHEKLPENRGEKIGILAGWHTHLDILVDKLNNKDPKGFWTVHMALEDEYEKVY